VYSFTGMETNPKEIEPAATGRAAILSCSSS
jgi:hypothetical protein